MINVLPSTNALKVLSTHILAAGLLTLASCAQLPNGSNANGGSHSTPVATATDMDHHHLLAFANAFPKLSLEAQRRELALLSQTATHDPRAKVQLAIAYSLPTSKVRDTAKAEPLLEDIISDKTADADSLALATIMRDYLNEIGKSGQKIKDEQKRADATQQRLDELQKKLDDLKNIEKTMVDRKQGVKK